MKIKNAGYSPIDKITNDFDKDDKIPTAKESRCIASMQEFIDIDSGIIMQIRNAILANAKDGFDQVDIFIETKKSLNKRGLKQKSYIEELVYFFEVLGYEIYWRWLDDTREVLHLDIHW